jgi:hypothetical protein
VRLILGIAEKDLFQLVLDSPPSKPTARAHDHSVVVAEEEKARSNLTLLNELEETLIWGVGRPATPRSPT